MGNLNLLLFVVAAALAWDLTSGALFHYGQCPPKFKVHNDKPACFSDADCQKYGKICCPNQYNTKSCTDRAPWYIKTSSKEKKHLVSSKPYGAGVYCNGVRCLPWEVCKPDMFTKQLKCQPA